MSDRLAGLARLTTVLLAATLAGGVPNKSIAFKLNVKPRAPNSAAAAITRTAHLSPATRIFPHAGKFEARHREHGLHRW